MIEVSQIFVSVCQCLFYTALVLASMIAVMMIDIRMRVKAKEVS
jgi:hypothetical protein